MIIYSEKMNFDSLYHYSTMYPDSIPTLYHQAYCYYMTGYALANMNLHEESARYMSLAKNLNRQLNNHVEYYRYLTQWASILLKTGKFSEAIDSLEYRLDEIRQTDKNMSYVETLKTLADAYKGQNRPREALEYLVRYSDAKDSAATEKSARKILEMQSRYEIEKKDTEIAQQAVLIRKQKVTNYVIGGCAAMFLVLGGVVFFGNRGRHRANAELAAARDHAERSEQFKRQFLANMSHEIRTPMNAVTGMIRLLIEKNPRGDQTAYLDAMRQSADSLLHIINDILDFSKMEAGKVSLEQIDFPVTDLMGQVENTLRLAADAKGIAFDVVTDPFIPPVVIGDPVRIAQILINLANNAIKFTPSGTVTVSAKRERGDVVSFAVEDTGIGIEPEKLESVFERFTQANASDTREYGGTGLGLSISRQLVSLMGGKLEVNSQLGKGTRFFFSLVLPEGDTQNRSTSLASKASASRIPDGIKILLVDDNEDNRLVARDTLESKAHVEIHEAVNGEEAVKKIMEADFDLVLMDVQMPVMDGYEATRRIRKLPSPKCNIPIIALTASVIRSDLEKCSESGMEDYVPKPFTTEQLLSAILRNILPKEAGSNLNPSASK
jgi:signal transduction histidine kinase/CheY-like chemotaxis protein